MINIIFYCNWGSNSIELLERYKLMTPNNSSIWKNLKGTTNLNEADYIVFLEGIPNNFNINSINNKKKIICFPREPLIKQNWTDMNLPNGYTYNNYIHVVTNPQFINKNYDFLVNLEYTNHINNFSAIISNKNNCPEYQSRIDFLINLSNIYPGLCDIYGAGWNNELGISYKGELGYYHNTNNSNTTKYDGLINYKYSLCIEPCSRKNYFSEKFTDAILCWTIPIYYGCSNISDYFPKNSYYYIDIKNNNSFEELKNIVNKPITEENIEALKIARNLILNKYNIWQSINDIIVQQ